MITIKTCGTLSLALNTTSVYCVEYVLLLCLSMISPSTHCLFSSLASGFSQSLVLTALRAWACKHYSDEQGW